MEEDEAKPEDQHIQDDENDNQDADEIRVRMKMRIKIKMRRIKMRMSIVTSKVMLVIRTVTIDNSLAS